MLKKKNSKQITIKVYFISKKKYLELISVHSFGHNKVNSYYNAFKIYFEQDDF